MQSKNTIFKSIFHLIGVNSISYFVLLLISIVIFRTVDKSHYGLYVMMLSLFAIIELLMAGFNDSIVRFLKDKITFKDKQNIVLFVLIYKYSLIFLFIAITYLARNYGFFEYLIGNYKEVSDIVDSFLIIAILNGILSAFIGVNNCILNAHHKYHITANIGLARNIIYLFVVVVLSFYTQDYLYYLYSNIVLSLFLLLFLAVIIYRKFYEFSFFSLVRAKFSIDTGKKYIFPYSAPLTGSSLLTYVKNHLPTLILGKEFALEDVAVFSIIKTFFKALHSVSGSFIDPMMSKFLVMKNNTKEFSRNMNGIFYGALALRVFAFIVLASLAQFFFLIYKIEFNITNQFVFYVLGVEYVLAGMMLSYGIVLRLEKNTKKVLIASTIRFVIELLLIYLILWDYGIIGAAIILLLARYVETVISFGFVSKTETFKGTWFVLILFALVAAFLLMEMYV